MGCYCIRVVVRCGFILFQNLNYTEINVQFNDCHLRPRVKVYYGSLGIWGVCRWASANAMEYWAVGRRKVGAVLSVDGRCLPLWYLGEIERARQTNIRKSA